MSVIETICEKTDGVMNNCLVSVIIPVYNVPEEFLNKSMSSLLAQSYDEIEIIMVDDGSEKVTADLCDVYAAKDSRIKVIHLDNSGVSRARNHGTAISTGKYVMYVDGDDILAPKAIEEAVNTAEENRAQIVIGLAQRIHAYEEFDYSVGSGGVLFLNDEKKKDLLRLVYVNSAPMELTRNYSGGYINRAPFCRLIRSELAKQTPFPEGYPIGEDAIWNLRLLNQCEQICICCNVWYGYYIHSGSAIRKFYGNRIELAEKYLNTLREENKRFCDENEIAFGKNVTIEFYCIVRFELMSKKCKLSKKEKSDLVGELVKGSPWKLMYQKNVYQRLANKYKALLTLSKRGLSRNVLWMTEKFFGKD
ncbi:MAG: glycosyltransferase family 2 protein [Lachnospiraceae bacterium]|nr:glycosyltransferase family 2 protein [Lachnospiraceae bacterium]